jgi:hypothetical protein
MEEYLKRLEGATDLRQVIELIDRIIEGVRSGQSNRDERRQFVRLILLNDTLLQRRGLNNLTTQSNASCPKSSST